jgi:hypothetical protein
VGRPSKSHVAWYKKRDDGKPGCHSSDCDRPATWWADMERWGIRRWLSTAYCDEHGGHELRDPDHVVRVRRIR